MAEQLARLSKNTTSKITYTTKGTNNFSAAGTIYTTDTYPITEKGLYIITYSQAGPVSASANASIGINGTQPADRIANVQVNMPGASPSAEVVAIANLTPSDTIYFTRASSGSTSTSDRAYFITVAKLA